MIKNRILNHYYSFTFCNDGTLEITCPIELKECVKEYFKDLYNGKYERFDLFWKEKEITFKDCIITSLFEESYNKFVLTVYPSVIETKDITINAAKFLYMKNGFEHNKYIYADNCLI